MKKFLERQLSETEDTTKSERGEEGKGGREGADKNESCWQERRGKQLRGF